MTSHSLLRCVHYQDFAPDWVKLEQTHIVPDFLSGESAALRDLAEVVWL